MYALPLTVPFIFTVAQYTTKSHQIFTSGATVTEAPNAMKSHQIS
jgi:hypothetical protein